MSAASVIALLLVAAIAGGIAVVYLAIRSRNMQVWLPAYLRRRVPARGEGPVHVMFCFVDHYEPIWGKVDWRRNVRASIAGAATTARSPSPSRCRRPPPQHSFFYPEEEYVEEYLDKLASLCADGYGEIEIHLHHDNDNAANFRATIDRFNKSAARAPQRAATRSATVDSLRFIHGNWSLDNSRRTDAGADINNELILLRELGCYADFTLPSAPSETQTSTINSIYYATDDPARPKSHDTGELVRVGGRPSGDLMIVQGPLGLNWRERRLASSRASKRRHPPTLAANAGRVDAGSKPASTSRAGRSGCSSKYIPMAHRKATWTRCSAHRPAMYAIWRKPTTTAALCAALRHRARNYNIIKAAEAGKTGNPGDYRDFILPPPPGAARTHRAA